MDRESLRAHSLAAGAQCESRVAVAQETTDSQCEAGGISDLGKQDRSGFSPERLGEVAACRDDRTTQ